MYKHLKTFIANYSTLFLFLIFFSIGILIFKDYGISIDEPFHRTAGYYWLIHICEKLFPNINLIEILRLKIENMYHYNHFKIGKYDNYGAIFDSIVAFIENISFIEKNINPFHLKHLFNFLIFGISGIIFFKIMLQRSKNKFLSILITGFYLTSPRIFAEAFYNSKDILFMSLITISIFFCFKILEKFSFKNILLLSLFLAIATQIRVIGFYLYFLLILFLFFSYYEKQFFIRKNILNLIYLIILFPLITIFLWPFMWENPILNFVNSLFYFSNYGWGGKLLYFGSYVDAKNLPWHYIPVWILITTPPIILISFLYSYIKTGYIFSKKFIALDKSNKNKLWSNEDEKKDYFVFFFFSIPIFMVVLLDSTLYGGWRHLYFIYPGLIYFTGVTIITLYKKKIKFLKLIIIFSLALNIFNLIKLHPYQNIYFNSFVEKNANKWFEVDYWGLGNVEAIKFILHESGNKRTTIRTASFTPLNYSKLMFEPSKIKNLLFTGTEQKNQDYIFTNLVFESNPDYLEKYNIPEDYEKVFFLQRGNIILNEVYKKR